jgi:hypothetical protein
VPFIDDSSEEDDVDQDAWEYLRKTRAEASVKMPRKMVTRA